MIVLIGFMGAGKTTVGRALAARLGWSFVDTDEVIERAVGIGIPDIFAVYGEPGFRELEARVIGEQLTGEPAVVALGGGAVTTPSVREALAGHQVVLLDISLADALGRIGGDPGRPILARLDLAEVYASRAELYASVASLRVPVAGRSVTQIVESIVAGEHPTAGTLDQPTPDAGE